jgi:hypothetical protein
MESHDHTLWPPDQPIPGHIADAGTDPPAARITELVASGRVVLVTLGGQGSGLLAAASVYAWLGVRVFRAPPETWDDLRQVLDMVESIKGTRPPALSRRALA